MPAFPITEPQEPLGAFSGTCVPSEPGNAVTGLKMAAEFRLTKQKTCKLLSCEKVFTPKDPAGAAVFCSRQCKDQYWDLAAQIGNRVLSGQMTITGKSQNTTILELLLEHQGHWLDRPRQRLPFVLWNSRVAELRRRGYDIRCRRVYREDIRGNEYQYRLFSGPEGKR
jgi:hypothetical protein